MAQIFMILFVRFAINDDKLLVILSIGLILIDLYFIIKVTLKKHIITICKKNNHEPNMDVELSQSRYLALNS